jgi:hypothetical protein
MFSLIILIGVSLIPSAQAAQGKWRSINPTQYTTIPDVRLNSVYMLNGGTGGIGAGDGWAVGNNGVIFHWDGFSWTNQSSGTNCNLYSVNFGSPLSVPMNKISSSAGFIVGGCASAPIALFWNGNSWSPANTGALSLASGNLSSVFMTSVSGSNVEAWAVGYSGTAGTSYHFSGIPGSGGGWVEVPMAGSTGFAVNSIYMVSTTEGWAVGFGGKIYHYNLGGWTNPYTFAGVNFYSIFMDSPTDGWAVGSGGQISRYTGGTWNTPTTPATTAADLRSITMISSSEAWAVGDGAVVVHGTSLTGSVSWTAVASNLVPSLRGVRSVHATGGSNVWAVGESGSILMYDGSIWGSITAPLQTNYNAVWMTGSNDGWAVGNRTTGVGGGSTFLHWDGVKWARAVAGVGSVDLYGVWEVNSGEAWAVGGGQGTFPFIAHYSGGAWTTLPTPTCLTPNCILRDVYGTSSNNIWAVGDGGLIAQWAGTSWSTAATAQPTTGISWRSVTFVGGDPNNGWAVGYNSTGPVIFQYTSLIHWVSVPVPAGVPASVRLNSIQFRDSSHGWIAGSRGTILFWDGSKWNIVATPSSAYDLRSIFVDSANDGWAVGQDTSTNLPIFLHYDGISWTTVATTPPWPTTSPGTLLGMYLLSSTDGFAVGTQPSGTSLGLMFHLDPPEGGPPPPPPATTTSIAVTTSTSVESTTYSTTSSATSSSISTSSSQMSTSTPQTSTSATSQVAGSTSSSSATSMSTITVTASSSQTTPLVVPAVPGFPWESIIAGVIIGLSVLVVLRQRRRSTST